MTADSVPKTTSGGRGTVLHKIVANSPTLAPRTRAKYGKDVDTWVAFAGADPRGWTRYRAQEFYQGLLGRMSPQTANGIMDGVRYASSWWAKKENRPDLDFAVVQKADAKTRKVRKTLDADQAQQLLATCNANEPIDLRDRALLVVGLETGMRRMSLQALTWENLRTTDRGGDYPVVRVPIKGSNGAMYAVPISDTALAALEPWHAWLKAQKVAFKGPVFRPLVHQIARGGKLVYEARNRPLSLPAIYLIVARRAGRAGLAGVHPHILRHTFITWRIQQGLQPYEIAAVTGHRIAGMPGMGALGAYVDAAEIARKVRNSTPPWLAALVRKAGP